MSFVFVPAGGPSHWWDGLSFGAFPGAQGYGTSTVHGRGAQVLRVTNTNPSGAGSYLAALQTPGPRVIIFDVSGMTDWSSLGGGTGEVEVGDNGSTAWDNLHVAGQTAPSPGFCVKGQMTLRVGHALIQHIRHRPGVSLAGRTGIEIIQPGHHIVLDHCSCSWGLDGNYDIFYANGDMTLVDCISSEALQTPGGGAGGYGMLIGGAVNLSVIRMLEIHNFDRHPECQGLSDVVWLNNLQYNNGHSGRLTLGVWHDVAVNGPVRASFIGNRARNGPDGSCREHLFGDSCPAGSEYYETDNTFPPSGGFVIDSGSEMVEVGSPPFALPSPLTILSNAEVEAFVRAHVGCRPLDRDAVDARLMADVLNSTGSAMIDDEADVGGYPSYPVNTRVLSVPGNHADIMPSGYSRLEEEVIFPQTQAVQPV